MVVTAAVERLINRIFDFFKRKTKAKNLDTTHIIQKMHQYIEVFVEGMVG